MSKVSLINEFYRCNIIQHGEFTLKSGLQSPFYLDFRRIVAYPDILKAISEQLWEIATKHEFDHLCGVPYAALSISSTTAST